MSARIPFAAALVAVAALVATLLAPPAQAAPALSPGEVTVALAGQVSPPSPDVRSPAAVTVTVPVTITNTGSRTLYDVQLAAVRSAPLDTRSALAAMFASTRISNGPGVIDGGQPQPVAVSLPAKASVTVNYLTDTSVTGVCLCYLGVYAVDIVASAATEPGGRDSDVGRLQTYLPSITGRQRPATQVGWVWSLLDRPHRETGGTVFTDDALAASVSHGGRLDRALQTVEQLDAADPAGRVRLLLLIDPETIAELTTMISGYTVRTAPGVTVPGTGGPAAAAWLARLKAVVSRHDVRFTAPADPDVNALAANGLAYQTSIDATSAVTAAAALGLPAVPALLAWPTGGTVSQGALRQLVTAGTKQLVLTGDGGTEDDLATLATGSTGSTGTDPRVLLADPAVDQQATAAVGLGAGSPAALQRLLAVLTITAVQNPNRSRFVAVVPGRYPDVNPGAAVQAILTTTGTSWSTPRPAAAALAGTAGDVRADLVAPPAAGTGLPAGQLAGAVAALQVAAGLRSAITTATGAQAVLGSLPGQIQRTASTAWAADPQGGRGFAGDLGARSAALAGAVQIVTDPHAGYSLASSDSPLLITVANNLPVDVAVRVVITPKSNVAGIRSRSQRTELVPAGSRPTLRIPTYVARPGQFDVTATLVSQTGAHVGNPVTLTVRSTAIGFLGQLITIGSGVLLALALLVRGVRRWRRRGSAGSRPRGSPPEPPPLAERSERTSTMDQHSASSRP